MQFAVHHAQALKAVEHIFRHALGKIHQAVIVKNLDAADHPALQTGLAGDGTHQVSGFDPIAVTHLNAVALHVLLRSPCRTLAPLAAVA